MRPFAIAPYISTDIKPSLLFPQWDMVTVILCVFLLSYVYGEGKVSSTHPASYHSSNRSPRTRAITSKAVSFVSHISSSSLASSSRVSRRTWKRAGSIGSRSWARRVEKLLRLSGVDATDRRTKTQGVASSADFFEHLLELSQAAERGGRHDGVEGVT